MVTMGVLMLFSSSFYLGYKVGNKYQFGLWTKESKPKQVGSNILKSFRKMDEE